MKQLKSFPSYFVTTEGEVYNSKGHKMAKQVNIDGYFVLNLVRDGKKYHRRVCRLVAECYLPNYCEELVVNHKDLNKQNDSLENLEMITAYENHRHSLLNQPLEHKKRSSLTISHVSYIYRLMSDGWTNMEISDITGFERGLIARIRNGTTWTGCNVYYEIPEALRNIDEQEAILICEYLQKLKKPSKVLKALDKSNITIDVIKSIKSRQVWKNISCDYNW